MTKKDFHVGLCGAGLGGMTAAIALAIAGARVTVLEAASELGEIGAGIQNISIRDGLDFNSLTLQISVDHQQYQNTNTTHMTPNVSRLLIKWGVASIIGTDLVEVSELNMRRQDGTPVGYTKIVPNIKQDLGYPWWVVHRAHLHAGLVKVAMKHGVTLLTSSRVVQIDHSSDNGTVSVTTSSGREHVFDLLVGSDGLNSIVRKTLFPTIVPRAPTPNCAYRAIVPFERLLADPLTKPLVSHGKMTVEVWMGHNSYIITYPISGGQDFNLVMSHLTSTPISSVQDVPVQEMRDQFTGYDERIKRVLEMVSGVQRWPLLVTGPLESWSSEEKNVVLMGDAAHSMTNHFAQGAATSMEDGAFLAKCIERVVHSNMPLREAIDVYEQGRMPQAKWRQQISFLNGQIWMLPEGEMSRARDKAMMRGLVEGGGQELRSSNLYGDPRCMWAIYGYDVEKHAEECLDNKGGGMDVAAIYLDWYMPNSKEGMAHGGMIRSKL